MHGTDIHVLCFFFFSSRRRHTRLQGDWSSDVCSSDLRIVAGDYSMVFVDGGQRVFESLVIVGTPKNPTPEIQSVMHGFQTNPYWTVPRSEERRVGKECRSRWSPYH